MAQQPLSSVETLTSPTQTRSKTRAIVGTVAGLALLSAAAFALIRLGDPADEGSFVVTEDFSYTEEALDAVDSPLGSHDGSITANANGELVLATLSERINHRADLPFRDNPDIPTTMDTFSRAHLPENVQEICTTTERQQIKTLAIAPEGSPFPENAPFITPVDMPSIDDRNDPDLHLRPGSGDATLTRIAWEARDREGAVIAETNPDATAYPRQLSFLSSDPSVAVVYPNGVILPISPGFTRITARFCGARSESNIDVTVTENSATGTLTWHPGAHIDTRFIHGSIVSPSLSEDLPEGEHIRSVDVALDVNATDFPLFTESGNLRGTYELYVSATGGAFWSGPFDLEDALSPDTATTELTVDFPAEERGSDLRYALRLIHDDNIARVAKSGFWSGTPLSSDLPATSSIVTNEDTRSSSALQELLAFFTPRMAQAQFGPPVTIFVNNERLEFLDILNENISLADVYGLFDHFSARETANANRRTASAPDVFTRGAFVTAGSLREIGMAYGLDKPDFQLRNAEGTWTIGGNGEAGDPIISLTAESADVAILESSVDDAVAAAPADTTIRPMPIARIQGLQAGFTELAPRIDYERIDNPDNINEFFPESHDYKNIRVVSLPETTLNVDQITFSATTAEGDPCIEELERLREEGVPEEDLPICDPEPIDNSSGDSSIDARIVYRGESAGKQRVIVKWQFKDTELRDLYTEAAIPGEPVSDITFRYGATHIENVVDLGEEEEGDILPAVDVYYDAGDEETPFYAVLTGLDGGEFCDISQNSASLRCGRGKYSYRVTTDKMKSDWIHFETLNRLQTVIYDYELVFGDQLKSQGLNAPDIETLQDLDEAQASIANLSGRIDGMRFYFDPSAADPETQAQPMSLSGVKFGIMNDRRYGEHSARLLATERRRGVVAAIEHLYAALHDRIYVEDLSRVCDEIGCDFWENEVTQNNVDRIDLDGVALAVLLSDEYSGFQAEEAEDVNAFYADYSYQTVLKRGGDEEGVNALAEQFEGVENPLEQMRYALALSNEFRDRITAINEAFGRNEAITELYESCFYRAADVEGVAYWELERTDLTIEDLRVNFCEEGEGTNSL